jgi:hypothetical protein
VLVLEVRFGHGGPRRATLPPVDYTDFFVSANSINFQIRGMEALAWAPLVSLFIYLLIFILSKLILLIVLTSKCDTGVQIYFVTMFS